MSRLFASGRIVEAIIALMILEALLVLAYRRTRGRGPASLAFVSNHCSGICLLLALRASLGGAAWPWIALALLGSLLGHLVDLSLRWNARAPGRAGFSSRRLTGAIGELLGRLPPRTTRMRPHWQRR
jgi:hypothetical protein